ncbi:MAG: threonine/serine exporter family protein [Clostridia bacterium]
MRSCLQNGAEAYRVEDTITRILSISGFARTEAFVTITGIFVTLEDPALDQPLTTVRRVYTHTTNLNKISVANDISRKLVSGALSLEEAKTALAGLKSLSAYPLASPSL